MASIKRVIPLLNRVLIQKLEAPKTTAGGIFLPDTKEQDLTMGKVIATGPGEKNIDGQLRKCLVNEGQTVLLPSYGGQVVFVNEEKLYIYRDTELVGIIN
ncbi:unnamed protein product [Blepharisma stoltei]|uniref:20 kDa chaperonin, chloroplastic n=1 Tax=Blepharisma stoltei TaxID=1481888 RepID=A0AAU9JZE7_9CILI|nr:unnamed protein product [Blepharisma stoltei]